MAPSTLKHVPTATGTARRSIAMNTLGPSKDKEGVWTRIEPIDERNESRSTSDEEIAMGVGGDNRRGSQEGIWQTTTITVEDEETQSNRDRKGKSWLN